MHKIKQREMEVIMRCEVGKDNQLSLATLNLGGMHDLHLVNDVQLVATRSISWGAELVAGNETLNVICKRVIAESVALARGHPKRAWGLEEAGSERWAATEGFSLSLWLCIYFVSGEAHSHPQTLKGFDISGLKEIVLDINFSLTSQICLGATLLF